MYIEQIPERIAYLTLLYLHGKLTAMGRREIDAWISDSDHHLELFDEATCFYMLDDLWKPIPNNAEIPVPGASC